MKQSIPSDLNKTVVILWRSMGPYHIARARAAMDFLKGKGLELVVIELCEKEDTRDWLVDRSGIPFEIVTLAPGLHLQPHTPSMAGVLWQQLEQLKPCAIAIAGYDRPEMRKAMGWCRRHGAVSILMSESKWDDRPRPWWKRAIIQRLIGLADAALVSGAASGEYMVTLGMPRERIFLHYGAIDNDYFIKETDRLKTDAQPSGHNLSDKYFMACCRMIDHRKNIRRMLLAYQAYRSKVDGNPWQLVICGDGKDREMLEHFASEHTINGVVFAGFQQLKTLIRYYAYAGCFIHPAINEAWGLVVNEAMAAGLPVLVSRRCGCAYDLVNDGVNGFTFDPYDVDELKSLMLKISLNAEDRRIEMGKASQALIRKWGPDMFAKGLWKAIEAAKTDRLEVNQ